MEEEERLKQEIIEHFPSSATFVTAKVLRRPPFAFIHALVRSIVCCTDGFAKTLLDEEIFACVSGMKKTDKIRFLTRILAYISFVTDTRVDIFVSPAKVLSGQDVHATRLFLRCMVQAAKFPPTELSWNNALSQVNRIGDIALYQKSLAARNAVAKVQAVARGKLARMHQRIYASQLMAPKGKAENNENLICAEKPRLPISVCNLTEAVKVINREPIIGKDASSTLNEGCKNEDHMETIGGQLNPAPLELQEVKMDLIAKTQVDDSFLPDIGCPIPQREESVGNDVDVVPRVPNLTQMGVAKSPLRIEAVGSIEHKANNVESKSTEIMTLREKYSAKIKRAQKLETQLAAKEVYLEQREGKLTKLADNLRRREATLILEKRKIRNSTDLEKKCREASQPAEETTLPKVIIKTSPSTAHIFAQKKIKEMESRLIEREQELARKEERMVKLSDNLRRQHDRLWVKQKKIEEIEARNSLKLSIESDQGSSKSGQLMRGHNQPSKHAHPIERNQVSSCHYAGSLISRGPLTDDGDKPVSRKSRDLLPQSLEKGLVRKKQRRRKRPHQEIGASSTCAKSQNKPQRNALDTSQQNVQTSHRVESYERLDKQKRNAALHDQNRQRKAAKRTKNKALSDFYQSRVQDKVTHQEGHKQANIIFARLGTTEVERKRSCEKNKCNSLRKLVQNSIRKEKVVATPVSQECQLIDENLVETNESCTPSCKENEKRSFIRQRRQSMKSVTKSQASSMYQSFQFSFEKNRSDIEQIHADTADSLKSKGQPLDEHFETTVKAALQRCSAVNIL